MVGKGWRVKGGPFLPGDATAGDIRNGLEQYEVDPDIIEAASRYTFISAELAIQAQLQNGTALSRKVLYITNNDARP